MAIINVSSGETGGQSVVLFEWNNRTIQTPIRNGESPHEAAQRYVNSIASAGGAFSQESNPGVEEESFPLRPDWPVRSPNTDDLDRVPSGDAYEDNFTDAQEDYTVDGTQGLWDGNGTYQFTPDGINYVEAMTSGSIPMITGHTAKSVIPMLNTLATNSFGDIPMLRVSKTMGGI